MKIHNLYGAIYSLLKTLKPTYNGNGNLLNNTSLRIQTLSNIVVRYIL
jgi:hypothetical protein